MKVQSILYNYTILQQSYNNQRTVMKWKNKYAILLLIKIEKQKVE